MIDYKNLIRDWMGRVIPMTNFHGWMSIEDTDLYIATANARAPLLHNASYTCNRTLRVEVFFSTIYPFEEARRDSLFSATDSSISNFIVQSILSLLSHHFYSVPSADTECSVWFCFQDLIYRYRFINGCRQSISKKKHVKKPLFAVLRSERIEARNRLRGKEAEERKIIEMSKVYNKFF